MDYIPSKIEAFYNWQNNLNTTVTNNATAWGIDPAEVTKLNNANAVYNPLYNAISNENTRTRQQVTAHNVAKKQYVAVLRKFVQQYLVNNPNVPVDEQVAMGLNPHTYIRSQRPTINSSPIISMNNKSGGTIEFVCRVQDSDSRGRHPDSNGVEIWYEIVPIGTTGEDDENVEFVASFNSTRAKFYHAFGLANVGKLLRVYGRWVNTSDAKKNGTFSGISTIVIS